MRLLMSSSTVGFRKIRQIISTSLSVPSSSSSLYHTNNGVYGCRRKITKSLESSSVLPSLDKDGSGLFGLVSAYRELGHRRAQVDPLKLHKEPVHLPELNPESYGIKM